MTLIKKLKKILYIFEYLRLLLKSKILTYKIKTKILKSNVINNHHDNFYIFIDLASFRATWDIIAFLVYSKIKAKNRECIIILISDDEEIKLYGAKEKTWMSEIAENIRIDNIIKPSLELFENFSKLTIILNDRSYVSKIQNLNNDNCFPNNFNGYGCYEWPDRLSFKINKHFKKNGIIPKLSAPNYYKKLVDQFIVINNIKKKIITITLRNSSFAKSKNSNIENWKKMYEYLITKNYYPLILEDFENTCVNLKSFSNYNTFDYANIDIRVRLSLYEKSFMNLGVTSGPLSLLTYSKNTNFIIFKHLNEDDNVSSSYETNHYNNGLDPAKDEQYSFYSSTQKIIWNSNEDLDYLIENFHEMEKKINNLN